MNIKGHVRVTVSVAAITVFSAVYILTCQDPREYVGGIYPRFESSDAGESTVDYLVHNPKCKLPDLEVWDRSTRSFFAAPVTVKCTRNPLLTFVTRLDNGSYVLGISESAAKRYRGPKSAPLVCCYSEIIRISQTPDNYDKDADNKFRFSECLPFEDGDVLPNATEFIRVKCMVKKKGKRATMVEVYRDAHALVPISPSVANKMEELLRKRGNESREGGSGKRRLSVLIIGVDSVSRLHARRALPKTVRYLLENKWIELKGYTKVADNTLPNLMPILTGRSMDDIERICSFSNGKSADDCPYIWKNFSAEGYVTAYGEDTPDISTFNYLRTGFVDKPTDYYLRPFMLGTHYGMTKRQVGGLPVCVGPVAAVDLVFGYARRFLATFNAVNHFSLFWMNSFTHNDPNVANNMDRPLLEFLRDLSDIGTYDNTAVFLLSDHGSRFGPFRRTFRAYHEERLPFMFVRFPEWFGRSYPELYDNLRTNQKKLTSPYDIHLTLDKILRADYGDGERGLPSCPNCSSLFGRIPWSRGCRDAAIRDVWCMCHRFREIPKDDPLISRLGAFLKDSINERIRRTIREERLPEDLCLAWTLGKIVRAHEVVSDEDSASNSRRFLLLVQLNPGGTHFEAMLRVDADNGTFAEEYPPSTVDGYSKLSRCTSSRILKYYCHCKNM